MSPAGGDSKTSTCRPSTAPNAGATASRSSTTIGKPREDDPLYPVYVQFERFRAAQYSHELSDKVWRGCCKIAEQGYWAGGPPPYATQRLLLDEKREPLHTLDPGQRKGPG